VMDNVALRILDPASSALAIRHDYTGGRSRDEILTAALRAALGRLRVEFGGGDPLEPADLDEFRRVHPRSQICSLTGVIGPGSSTLPGTSCVTMPYQDRGSWVHLAGFENP
jgi:penicillin G amidase